MLHSTVKSTWENMDAQKCGLEEKMAALLLYWLHSFSLACLMFCEKLCCVRRPHFPLINLSEVGAQHGNSVSDDSVKPILFCFFCQVGSLGSDCFMVKQRKKRLVWHVQGPGLSNLSDGVYNYTCSHGLQPWVWFLTTPQAQENIKQKYFCPDAIHFLWPV